MKNIAVKIIMFLLIFFIFRKEDPRGQNPITTTGVSIAYPSAHVWKDGKMYLLGSRDESPGYYCSWRHDVLSSSDLKTWFITENVSTSKGKGAQVPYSDFALYTPECQYKNAIYYFVYAHMDKVGWPTCIGYTTSKSL